MSRPTTLVLDRDSPFRVNLHLETMNGNALYAARTVEGSSHSVTTFSKNSGTPDSQQVLAQLQMFPEGVEVDRINIGGRGEQKLSSWIKQDNLGWKTRYSFRDFQDKKYYWTKPSERGFQLRADNSKDIAAEFVVTPRPILKLYSQGMAIRDLVVVTFLIIEGVERRQSAAVEGSIRQHLVCENEKNDYRRLPSQSRYH